MKSHDIYTTVTRIVYCADCSQSSPTVPPRFGLLAESWTMRNGRKLRVKIR